MFEGSKCSDALDLPAPPMPQLPTVFVVAAALIDFRNNILLAQRPEGKDLAGLWEFPGGKVNPGELPEYALMRELEEELGIQTRPCCMTPVGFVSHSYEKFHLIMPLFAIRVWKGIPKSLEGQPLKWVKAQDMYGLPMPDADRPLIPQLEAAL